MRASVHVCQLERERERERERPRKMSQPTPQKMVESISKPLQKKSKG
jgi:hypothetical protein